MVFGFVSGGFSFIPAAEIGVSSTGASRFTGKEISRCASRHERSSRRRGGNSGAVEGSADLSSRSRNSCIKGDDSRIRGY